MYRDGWNVTVGTRSRMAWQLNVQPTVVDHAVPFLAEAPGLAVPVCLPTLLRVI